MGVKQNNLMNTENKFKYDIGFIGRLSEKKGISCLFKALTEISSIQPNITVAIAGDGEIYDSLLKQSLEIPNIKI